MKLFGFFLSSLLVLSFSTNVQAKENTLTGDAARSLMETLASSDFDISNIDEEWSGKTLEVQTGPLSCHYTAVRFPDEWMSSVTCRKGIDETGPELKNPLSLAQAIKEVADADAGVGNRWLSVEDIKCSLVYDDKAYSCTILTKE